MSNKYEEISKELGHLLAPPKLINVGFGNLVMAHRIVSIMEANSLPMKRLREKASEKNILVDATAGRKMRSVVVMNSGHLIVSALSPQTLGERLCSDNKIFNANLADLEWEEGEFVS